MPTAINAALLFLINTLFDLYLFVLIIRLILVYVGANYFDPLTQFIVKLTDPIIKPLRRLAPNFKRIELATLLFVFFLECIKFALISFLSFGGPNLFGLLLLAASDSIKLIILTFFYAIILGALLSWIQPSSRIIQVVYQITSPVMRPFQRFIPAINGIDISPIFAIIFLYLLIILIVDPLSNLGISLTIT
ncbi:MAG TPA: YggT family protein [Gammaproteobacteria bacterium]|jgi:YggT family protein|nr:YggT family protein [Gammaproteobacteria bacterium]